MKRLILTLVLFLLPCAAIAAVPTYSGNHYVPAGASLTFQGSGGGCLLVDSSGKAYVAACPIGTVAFSAAAPFTVTGTGPYVIGCSTCFTTSGGTITGATTFSGALNASTFVASSYITGSSLELGAHGTAGVPVFETSTGNVIIGCDGSAQNCPVQFWTAGTGSGSKLSIDNVGNVTTAGQMTAAQYNVGSKRAWKFDIHPLPFDALQVLHDTDFATFRYRKGHGDPRVPHVGIIADDSPSVLSGEKHDHLDIEALATVDAKAVLELDTQIKVLYLIILSLTILIVLLALGLGVCLYEKNAS